MVVERLLGVGGRCAVWSVSRTGPPAQSHVWADFKRPPPVRMALKVPLRRPRGAPSQRGLEQEFEAMLPMMHPHLIRPWGIAQTTAGPGLLLDLYQGGSMAALLRSAGPLSLGETVTALTPVAEACAHLHQLGAAHGDVTAANILLTPEGLPALADLGDAQLLGMPVRDASPAADVAALAATAWFCLTGQLPEARQVRLPLGSLRPDLTTPLISLLEESLEPSGGITADEFARELYSQAEPEPLNLMRTADEQVLAELPTVLPEPAAKRPLVGWFRRLWGPARKAGPHRSRRDQAQSPNWASKLPSSRRAFRV